MSNFLTAVAQAAAPEFITFADLDRADQDSLSVKKNHIELKLDGRNYAIAKRRFNQSDKAPTTKLYIAGENQDWLIPEDTTEQIKLSWEK